MVGLEVHSELSTNSKIYCGCSTKFGQEVNTQCCPICTGMPGVLPVLNRKVVEYAIKAGIATNCRIAKHTKQDRKNYFYPDLPKAYQISQHDIPICIDGHIDIVLSNGQKKRIRIYRIHIEEDAGKLIHDGSPNGSLVDCNRCGVPLIEVVTEPDMCSAEEAKLFLEKLKSILQSIEISDCKMQEGSYRCDVNVSVKKSDDLDLGVRTEMKNLNSIKAAMRAIESEKIRQIEIVSSGKKVQRETRRWDDEIDKSFSMRSKEEETDYRYIREPDLPSIVIDQEWIDSIKKSMSELPEERKNRYISEFGLSEYDASLIIQNKEFYRLFEDTIKIVDKPKLIVNWIIGEIFKLINDRNLEHVPIDPPKLAELLKYIISGSISNSVAKSVLVQVLDTNKSPSEIITEQNLGQINNQDQLREIVKTVLADNKRSVEDYKTGKSKALDFLIGRVMRETKGQGNPQILSKLIQESLTQESSELST